MAEIEKLNKMEYEFKMKELENEYKNKEHDQITKLKNEIQVLTLNQKQHKHEFDSSIIILKNEKNIEIMKIEEECKAKNQSMFDSLNAENQQLKNEMALLTNKHEEEKYTQLNKKYETTENTITELHKTIEEIKVQTTKGNLSQDKGKCGENYFFELATDIFGDMDDFTMEDTTKTGHAGDYLLKFKEFTIMAECKNFHQSKVPSTDLRKFKADIKSNQHIRIAWMVSLNKGISNYDKYPVETEFENGVLYCYINSLTQWGDNQRNILTSCWKFCREVYMNMFDKENENSLKITGLMKGNATKKMIAERGRKKIKEMKAMVEQLKTTIYELENDLIDIIKGDILLDSETQTNSLKNWWNEHLILDEGKDKKHKIDLEEILQKYKEFTHTEEMTMDVFILNIKEIAEDIRFNKPKTKNSKKFLLNYSWVVL
jgi:hypothetical protein